MVPAYTHIVARMYAGAPLSNQYSSGIDRISSVSFHAEPF